MSNTLIFIYNADSGLGNMIVDSAHKIFSPSTYECSLCDLTYGAFSEKSVWKNFREQSEVPMQFLHKDEFLKEYASKFRYQFTYPIVLVATNKGLEVFIKTEELNEVDNLEALIALVTERIKLV